MLETQTVMIPVYLQKIQFKSMGTKTDNRFKRTAFWFGLDERVLEPEKGFPHNSCTASENIWIQSISLDYFYDVLVLAHRSLYYVVQHGHSAKPLFCSPWEKQSLNMELEWHEAELK